MHQFPNFNAKTVFLFFSQIIFMFGFTVKSLILKSNAPFSVFLYFIFAP